jgi:hypothetical protein
MEGIAFLTALVAGFGAVVCWWWLLIAAFREDSLVGLLSFVFPPAILTFVVARWKKARTPFLFLAAFLVLAALGFVFGPEHFDV